MPYWTRSGGCCNIERKSFPLCVFYNTLRGQICMYFVLVISRKCSVILLNTDLVWKKEEKKSVFMHKRNYEVKNYYCAFYK